MVLSRVTGSAVDTNDQSAIHWQHCQAVQPTFDPRVFEDQWLTEQGYVVNSPSAGRGASLFLEIDEHKLVLRHYRRGGLVRNFSEQSYLWLGLDRTRAWREFNVLCLLESKGLPAPKPYACQVKHSGLRYNATLITHYLNGLTLAEKICAEKLTAEQWYSIGHCISRFHQAGVNHADLNAHNILIANNDDVSLIDFDRASINQKAFAASNGARNDNNLKRLKRSLQKIDSCGPSFYDEAGWLALMEGYESSY